MVAFKLTLVQSKRAILIGSVLSGSAAAGIENPAPRAKAMAAPIALRRKVIVIPRLPICLKRLRSSERCVLVRKSSHSPGGFASQLCGIRGNDVDLIGG